MFDKGQLLAALVRLTGDLFSSEHTSGSQLTEVRRTLLRALRRGQPLELVTPSDSIERPWPRPGAMINAADLRDLEAIIDVVDDGSGPTPLIVRRTRPIASRLGPRLGPSWARGWRPTRTVGPFLEASLRPVWFDIWEKRAGLVVSRASGAAGGSAEPLLTLSEAQFIDTTRIDWGAGSVWVRSRAFDQQAPMNGWFVVATTHGRLISSEAFVVGSDGSGVLLPAQAEVRVELALAAGPAETNAFGPLGADGRGVSLAVPERMVLTLPLGPGTAQLDGGVVLNAFGGSLNFAAGPADALVHDALSQTMIMPLKADGTSLVIVDQLAQSYRLAGSATVTRAGLAFQEAVLTEPSTPAGLGPADGSPALRLSMAEGLSLKPDTIGAGPSIRFRLTSGELLARRGELWLSASASGSSEGETLLSPRWAANGTRTGLRLRNAGIRLIELASVGGPVAAESIVRRATPLRGALDRPMPASGEALVIGGAADVELLCLPDQTTVLLNTNKIEPEFALQAASFALENALIRTSKLQALELHARIGEAGLVTGWMTIFFNVDLIVPTLPDPYASDFLPWDRDDPLREPGLRREPFAGLVGAVDWRTADDPPAVTFGLRESRPPLIDHSSKSHLEGPDAADRRKIERTFVERMAPGFERCRLVDVSGAVDFLGLALFSPANADGVPELDQPEPFAIDRLSFTAPIDRQHLLLLPGFQNEAVANTAQPNVVPAFPDLLPPAGEGGAQRMTTANASIVTVAPGPLAQRLAGDFTLVDYPLNALFNLPFGIKALATVDRLREDGGTIEPITVATRERRDFREVWQLRLRATEPTGVPDPLAESPSLRGAATQLKLGTSPLDGKPLSAIGEPFTKFFNNEFSLSAPKPRVPVRQIDISGRGNSVMSDWHNPKAGTELTNAAGVRQARFEALVGRAIHEVVKIASVCHPWNLAVVRDVVLRRTSGGGVWRSDSGWQAASDALVDYDPAMGIKRHLGPLVGLRAIDNIRELDDVYTAPGVELRAVRFDAIAEIEGVDGPVSIRSVVGWVQIEPTVALTSNQLYDLLERSTGKGPAYGQLDATVEPQGTGLGFAATGLGIELTLEGPGQRALCGTLRGALNLPARGMWSVTRKNKAQAAPLRLGVGERLPLVGDGATWRLREPLDLFAATPANEYGLLHSSDSHRFLVRDPLLTPGVNGIGGQSPAIFADQFVMAGHAGLVPPAELCMELPAATRLTVPERGHLALDLPGGEFQIPANGAGVPWRVLTLDEQGAEQALRLEYRDLDRRPAKLRFAIDTRAPNGTDWSMEIRSLSITGEHDFLGNFITSTGDLLGSSAASPAMSGPTITFSDLLAPAQEIIDILKYLSFPTAFASQASEGDVLVSFGGSIEFPQKPEVKKAAPHPHAVKHLKPGGDYASTGAGKLKGEIGAFFTIYKGERGAHGHAGFNSGFRFEMGGKLLFATGIPLLYAGGSLKFKYEYDSAPKRHKPGEEPTDVEQTLSLYAGGVGNLGTGDNPLVEAELTASQHYVLKLVNGAFKFGIEYEIEAKVEVLEGLAELAGGFTVMTMPKRVILPDVDNFPDDVEKDLVEVDIEAVLAGEVTLGWLLHTEVEVPIEIHLGLNLGTFAAFAFNNPLLVAGEAL